jgi:hypothetical protein
MSTKKYQNWFFSSPGHHLIDENDVKDEVCKSFGRKNVKKCVSGVIGDTTVILIHLRQSLNHRDCLMVSRITFVWTYSDCQIFKQCIKDLGGGGCITVSNAVTSEDSNHPENCIESVGNIEPIGPVANAEDIRVEFTDDDWRLVDFDNDEDCGDTTDVHSAAVDVVVGNVETLTQATNEAQQHYGSDPSSASSTPDAGVLKEAKDDAAFSKREANLLANQQCDSAQNAAKFRVPEDEPNGEDNGDDDDITDTTDTTDSTSSASSSVDTHPLCSSTSASDDPPTVYVDEPFSTDSYHETGYLQHHYGSAFTNTLFNTLSNTSYTSRDAPEMKSVGHTMHRDEIFLVDSTELMPIYQYTGFQWKATEHYQSIEAFEDIKHVVDEFDKVGMHFNHVTCTRYLDGSDSIGFHSDKTEYFTPNTAIVILSLGAPRTFCLEHKVSGATTTLTLKHGDLFQLGWETNMHYKHSFVEDSSCTAVAISIILRDIDRKNSTHSADVVKYKINKAAEEKIKRGVKGQEIRQSAATTTPIKSTATADTQHTHPKQRRECIKKNTAPADTDTAAPTPTPTAATTTAAVAAANELLDQTYETEVREMRQQAAEKHATRKRSADRDPVTRAQKKVKTYTIEIPRTETQKEGYVRTSPPQVVTRNKPPPSHDYGCSSGCAAEVC